ncbi:MAG: SET domain-containing protein-lysine N-methyltransferase [Patescibacteria group bacterium]|nr:SET domain-containing protein-lysine N-methyltransferase [Patescibacteria group bacterium]
MVAGLVVRRNRFGRGVYTTARIARGQIVAQCPVLVWPVTVAADEFIGRYVWSWKDSRGHDHALEALCLGLPSLFNHDPKPNTGSQRFYRRRRMVFKALRNIAAGEEILIDYGAGASGFDVR